jgi:hypothetical protein
MAIDPHWDNVVLLLPMEGAHDVPIVQDLKGHVVSVSGNAKLSTAQSPVSTGSSLYLDGQDSPGTYLSIPDSEDWHWGSNPYTVEFWLYIVALKAYSTWLFVQSNNTTSTVAPLKLSLSSAGKILVDGSSNNSGWVFTALETSSALSTGTWYHIEASDNGTTFNVFVDGVVKATRASWPKTDYAYPLCIGGGISTAVSDKESNVYIGPVRVTKGVCRHTAGFSIPTARFPIPIITGSVRDASASPVARTVLFHDRSTQEFAGGVVSDATTGAFTFYPPDFGEFTAARLDEITYPYWTDVYFAARLSSAGFPIIIGETLTTTGSVTVSTAVADPFGGSTASALFAGAGTYLSCPGGSSKTVLGTTFTFQCWVRLTSFDATRDGVWYVGDLTSNNDRTAITIGPTGVIDFFCVTAGVNLFTMVSAAGVITTGTWYHVAAVRHEQNVYLFVNGALVASSLVSGTESIGNRLYLGAARYSSVTRGMTGRMFDVRLSNRAEYLAPFTPPTAQLFAGPVEGGSGENILIYDRVVPGAWE